MQRLVKESEDGQAYQKMYIQAEEAVDITRGTRNAVKHFTGRKQEILIITEAIQQYCKKKE